MKRNFYLFAIITVVTLLHVGCDFLGPISKPRTVDIGISIADLSGNDMFDTTNANAYNLDSIRIYRKNPDSGEIQLVNKGYNFHFYVPPYII